jgi:uncharacterized RDD family membrane protein YckC
MDTARGQRVLQGADHVLLPDDVGEGGRTVLSGDGEVRHGAPEPPSYRRGGADARRYNPRSPGDWAWVNLKEVFLSSTNPFEPDPEGAQYDLAGISDRIAASILDSIVLFGPIFVLAFGMVLTGLEGPPYEEITGFAYALWFFGVCLYQWFWIATDGTTIGKRQMGIHILRDDGTPVGAWRALVVRQWLMAVPRMMLGGLGSVLMLLDVAMVLGERRKCLHDWLAGTVVVHDRRGRARKERTVRTSAHRAPEASPSENIWDPPR